LGANGLPGPPRRQCRFSGHVRRLPISDASAIAPMPLLHREEVPAGDELGLLVALVSVSFAYP
jgi:hypothetical protein